MFVLWQGVNSQSLLLSNFLIFFPPLVVFSLSDVFIFPALLFLFALHIPPVIGTVCLLPALWRAPPAQHAGWEASRGFLGSTFHFH